MPRLRLSEYTHAVPRLGFFSKVRQHGSGAESQARALRADQGLYTQNQSNIEPEMARVCQRVAVRARVGVRESHREPERDRERSSKSQREPVKA